MPKRTRKFTTKDELTPEQIEKIVELYAVGKGVSTLTVTLGVTDSAVRHALKVSGVTMRTKDGTYALKREIAEANKPKKKALLWPYGEDST